MIRVQVADDFSRFGIAILIGNYEDGRCTASLQFTEFGQSWEEHERGAQIEPTLRLEHEEAEALLAALATRYQGVDDQRALRKDYDAERGRVDKLIDVVTGIAQTRPVVVQVPGAVD